MSDTIYRHWQPGDDEGVLRILAPMGWCTPERYATKFDDPGLRPADVLVAEQAGQIVGHLMLPQRRVRFGQTTLPLGGIGMVVVDPATRGQGVGRQLLDRALAHHRAAGNALAALFTMPTLLPAYEMYQRRGFVPATRRVVVHLSAAGLGPPPTGLRARPATEADRPGLTRLLDDWALTQRAIGAEAETLPLTDRWVAVDTAGAVVGQFEVVERPEGRRLRRLLASPATPVAAVLAVGLHSLAMESVQIATNERNRVYTELTPLAEREERDDSTLMVAPLSLTRILAGLALEVLGQLRAAGAAPVQTTLALAGTSERVRLEWDGRVLLVEAASANTPDTVTLSGESLISGLMGQPASPPDPSLTGLWAALFPPSGIEMALLNCW